MNPIKPDLQRLKDRIDGLSLPDKLRLAADLIDLDPARTDLAVAIAENAILKYQHGTLIESLAVHPRVQ